MEGPHGLGVGGEGVADQRAGNDDADDRDADEPRHTRDGVVDRGRDAGVCLVGVREDGGRQRGNREGETEPEDEQRREQVGDVGRAHVDAKQ